MTAVLDTGVLVLNRVYQPVHITTVRRAFSLLYQGLARALDAQYQTFDYESWSELSADVHDGDVVRTVSRALRVPRVIVLSAYDRIPRSHVRFSRQNIYLRDNCTCQYCGVRLQRSELNLDHVVPRARGGRTTWENIVCSCIDCNLRKGGRTPPEAGMVLLRTPARPRWTPFARAPSGRRTYEEWKPFFSVVDASYWMTELEE